MGEADKKENKKERRFSQEQYDMLKRCSDKKDITEWNKWREENPDKDILLEGAELHGVYLKRANLKTDREFVVNEGEIEFSGEVHLEDGELSESNLEGADLGGAHLENASLYGAHLESARLSKAYLKEGELLNGNLEHANLNGADLENADIMQALLNHAQLRGAYLEGACLTNAVLKEADLCEVYLKGASLNGACFQGAALNGANLQGADLTWTDLQGADLSYAIVDGGTLISGCSVDRYTDFCGVGLDNARIDSSVKQLLEYNIRRMNWEDWYWRERLIKYSEVFEEAEEENKSWVRSCHVVNRLLMTFPVRVFWWMSDYGRSTGRIIFTFFGLAVVFAFMYWLWPSCIVVNGQVGNIRGWWHALYSSVVTPFGVGDIAANPDSLLGQTLLMIQVILGYVLLGALVTRFAVLFTAGGPAGKFTEEKKEESRDEETGK